MNKKEIIKAIATKTGYTQKATENFVNAFWDEVQCSLSKNEPVTFVGYATFSVRQRASRKTINPKTKQMMTIPAKQVPVFKAGKLLKEAVN